MAQSLSNRSRLLEKYIPVVRQDGLNTNKNVNIGINGSSANLWVSGNVTVGGTTGFTGSVTLPVNSTTNAPVTSHTPVAINSTATATATQVASGYITSTSAAATTITLPTATAIAAAIGAVQGTVFDLYIDNTAGSNTVTITPDSSMTKSQVAQVTTYGVPTFGLFTVATAGNAEAVGCFRMVFTSSTALTIARIF